MVNLDTFNEQLAQVERDILESDGEVTLVLTGPHPCGHGPGPDGQLSVDRWDNDIEDAEQYFFTLQRDPADDPDAFLLAAANRFVQWLSDHGASAELESDLAQLPVNDQLVVVAPVEPERCLPSTLVS